MCWKCKNPCCEQCPTTPPEGLTEKDLEKGGWNNQPSKEELEKIRLHGKKAIESGRNIFDILSGRKI